MATINDLAKIPTENVITSGAGVIFTIDNASTSANPRVIFSDVNYTLNSDDNFKFVENVEAIKGSVWNIVNTRFGERVMRPNFGINIKSFLFEPLTWDNIRLIQFHLMKAFSMWDPRISVAGVKVLNDPTESNTLEILINLKIKGLDRSIPFLLKGSTNQF